MASAKKKKTGLLLRYFASIVYHSGELKKVTNQNPKHAFIKYK